jgi:isopentenyl phosphate kinase
MARLAVVKFGGSVITYKHRPFTLRKQTLFQLARELKTSPLPVVLVHGGGSFAHPLARKYGKNLVAGFLEIHRAMERLNSEVMSALEKARVPAISLPPASFIQVRGGEIAKSEVSLLKWLLKRGITPVTYGDVFPDREGACIVSGDKIACHLALRLHAKLAIFCLDVDGIYLRDKKGLILTNEFRADDLPKLAELPSKSTDVTGGIREKIKEALRLAESPTHVYFINGLRKGFLSRTLRGERGLGTEIH